MSSLSTIWQRIQKTVLATPGSLFQLLNRENFRKLFKAIRNEPPDLILENFLRLLSTGKPQAPYPPQFIDHSPDLKFYILYCRKEKGILKVMLWVLARNGLQQALILNGDTLLTTDYLTYIKPELSEMYAAFSGFEQQGLIFETPFDGGFSTLQLHLSDLNGNRVSFPIGAFSLRKPFGKEFNAFPDPDHPPNVSLILLITAWGRPQYASMSANFQRFIDGSLRKWVSEIIFSTEDPSAQAGDPPRLRAVHYLSRQLLNDYLKQVEFDYLLHLSIDSEIDQRLFPELLNFLSDHQGADLVYFDEALQEGDGYYHSSLLKPEFSPEYLLKDHYIGPNYCMSKTFARKVGWFHPEDQSHGAYALLLRSLIHHPVAHRLPHSDVQIYLPDYEYSVWEAMLAKEQEVRDQRLKLERDMAEEKPLVSIIIPFKDEVRLLRTCLESIYRQTAYPHFEIVLISNNSLQEETYAYLKEAEKQYREVRCLRWDYPFNYSALNNWGVQQAGGEVLLFLNNDVEVLSENWLYKLLEQLSHPGIGAVGAKLLYPDNTVQHAGVMIGIGGIAAHVHKHLPHVLGGYAGRANITQNVSAVTAACLLVRRSVFEFVGGFDAENLPIAFNDVDLCLKIVEAGYRIVYVPQVLLYHFESVSRGAEDTPAKRRRARKEIRFFRRKWRDKIRAGDPFYHPGFTDRRADFEERFQGETPMNR
ncbi:MAG: glycosyltransferase family 2 protein [Saprospiraceae bacterium]|nr:glycosyltransferase family 2 protein [Lewinella sp.]